MKKIFLILFQSIAVIILLIYSLPYIYHGINVLAHIPASLHQKEARVLLDSALSKTNINDREWLKSNYLVENSKPFSIFPFVGYEVIKKRLLNSKIISIKCNGYDRNPFVKLNTISYDVFIEDKTGKHGIEFRISFAYYQKRWWLYSGQYGIPQTAYSNSTEKENPK